MIIHNIHNRQTSMPPMRFEPTISAGERPQNYALELAATGISILMKWRHINRRSRKCYKREAGCFDTHSRPSGRSTCNTDDDAYCDVCGGTVDRDGDDNDYNDFMFMVPCIIIYSMK